jgi:hypothetical protein
MISKSLAMLSLLSLGRAQAQLPQAPSLEPDSLEVVEFGLGADSLRTDTLYLEPACWGEQLAEATRVAADSYREKPGQRLCYRYVKQGVSQALGLSLTGASAYMAAQQLAATDQFREVKLKPADLKSLPAGSIVVWGRSKKHPHGHVSVADGEGREISDRVRPQITNYGTKLRVFVPECQEWASTRY